MKPPTKIDKIKTINFLGLIGLEGSAIILRDLIVLTVYGKLPPTGANAWVGFFAAVAFILLFVLLPVITKLDQKRRG